MSERYRTIASLEEFEALGATWDALVRSMAMPTPFLLHGWLSEWWRYHGGHRDMAVAAAFRGSDLVAAMPVEIERRWPIRVAHMMGRHHAALSDIVAADPQEARAHAQPLFDHVTAALTPDYFDLFGVREGTAIASTVEGAAAGMLRRADSPVLDLGGGWDHVYREKTSSRRRSLHARRWRQLGEFGPVTVTVASDPDTVAAAMDDAFRLHDLRWHGRPDGSEFTTPDGRRFNTAAASRLAGDGVARIVTLRTGETAVAFHYYFMLERRMYVYRLAFDPAYSRCSPGQLATLAAVEHAAAEGATAVEFLGGAERYKIELADRLSPMFQVIGLPRTVRGRIASGAQRLAVNGRLRLKENERARDFYFETLAPTRRVLKRFVRRRTQAFDDRADPSG
jgi:CelD/BcsL family acetyltransferase involved in cellulose biosynthesis